MQKLYNKSVAINEKLKKAIELVESGKCDSLSSVAKELNVPYANIWFWLR